MAFFSLGKFLAKTDLKPEEGKQKNKAKAGAELFASLILFQRNSRRFDERRDNYNTLLANWVTNLAHA